MLVDLVVAAHMHKKSTIENVKQTGWSKFLADAEAELQKAEDRVLQLKAAVRIFRQKADAHEAVPEYLKHPDSQQPKSEP